MVTNFLLRSGRCFETAGAKSETALRCALPESFSFLSFLLSLLAASSTRRTRPAKDDDDDTKNRPWRTNNSKASPASDNSSSIGRAVPAPMRGIHPCSSLAKSVPRRGTTTLTMLLLLQQGNRRRRSRRRNEIMRLLVVSVKCYLRRRCRPAQVARRKAKLWKSSLHQVG